VSASNESRSLALTTELLEHAYRNGIFPMGDDETGEIDWYQPDPRTVIDLENFHVSRRLAKTIRSGKFTFTVDQAFSEVIRHCSGAHPEDGVWITDKIMELYCQMHAQGKAHSVEVWRDEKLVGGLYGVSLGAAFMGESMFHIERDASKAALVFLVNRLRERGFVLLDTQFPTTHLSQFGLIMLPHTRYMQLLRAALAKTRVDF
jgi:leucyl/phenylalanyl-tRNA---protein transferase